MLDVASCVPVLRERAGHAHKRIPTFKLHFRGHDEGLISIRLTIVWNGSFSAMPTTSAMSSGVIIQLVSPERAEVTS
jgi:hypothetical protein